MNESLPPDMSREQIRNHPILKRVLEKMEERLADGDDTTAHTAHNSHYSSLTKEDADSPSRP